MTQTQEYYISNSEGEMLRDNASSMLEACGHQKFNLIDLGAGDGTKTKILLEKAVQESYQLEYIPIDISYDSNVTLSKTMNEF